MNKKRATQLGLLILALACVLVAGTLGKVCMIIGLSILAAILFWYALDYYKANKKYLAVLMAVAALAVVYIIFQSFIMPYVK